ncbi:MAG TPA: restriction endonuclease subunit S [Candidatus Avalokitesvara rifleensis]|uniref:restriction endonuclease subunit S n=1 Tax=Candidatus Avalokitesvara rifleensis TaxID=3367620 RepID=UPI0027142E91|nr:restriction endonuclease subunit S [Candidatus Brocadiales bacterium]
MEKTIPKSWKVVKFGDVCKLERGFAFKSSDYVDKGILSFRVTNIGQNGLPDLTDAKFLPESFLNSYAEYLLNKDDFVVVMVGATTGKVGRITANILPALLNQNMWRFSPNENYLCKRFLYFLVQKLPFLVQGGAQGYLKQSDFNQTPIPFPPLLVQHRIVEILEEADNLRKLRRQADEKMKDLIPSLFVEMFGDPTINPKGWKTKKLGEACDVRDGTHDTPKYQQEGIPLITSKNLVGDNIDFENVQYISEQDHKKILQRSLVENGDILFAMIGTIGNPAIVDTGQIFSIKNVALFKFRDAKYLINYYLKHLLNNSSIITRMTTSSRGITQRFVSLNILRNFKIPLPPLPLQQEFAERVKEIEAEKERQAESKNKLDDLFNSLMQRAFNGELVA